MHSRWTMAPLAAFAWVIVACSGSGGGGEAAAGKPGEPSHTSASPVTTQDASINGVVPADRRTTWNPGVTYGGGGIPDRGDVCATLAPGGDHDTPAIQEALDTCPEGQVVQLTAGTFAIRGEGLFLGRSRITLRGVGPGTPGTGEGGTRLVKVDQETERNFPLLYVGHNAGGFAASIDLAEDAIKGANTATVVENPGLQAGEYVLIDHVTNNDPVVVWGDQHEGPGGGSRTWFSRQDRSLSQIVEITAVDGNRLTFATPLHWSFRVGYQAQLSRYGEPSDGTVQPFVEWVGIEDISFEGGMGGDYNGNVSLNTCAYCWVRNIESTHAEGTSVGFYGTYRSELRDSYIHSAYNPNPGGGGYLTGINYGASDNLIENNVLWNGNKMIVMRASGGGNVVAYNYMQDGYGEDYKSYVEVGLNATHYTTPHMELLEGNESWNFDGDSVWGNSVAITVFRNHLTGQRRNAGDLGLTDEGNRVFIALNRFQYDYNFVGNVLGSENMDLVPPQERFVYEVDAVDDAVVPMWQLGYHAEDSGQPFDSMVAGTAVRHGNFDYATRDVAWDANLPRDLPPSLYLAEKPSFFGEHAWPWVRPEDGGAVGTLPAKARFDAIHGSR